mgnify:CR=1 FL=1
MFWILIFFLCHVLVWTSVFSVGDCCGSWFSLSCFGLWFSLSWIVMDLDFLCHLWFWNLGFICHWLVWTLIFSVMFNFGAWVLSVNAWFGAWFSLLCLILELGFYLSMLGLEPDFLCCVLFWSPSLVLNNQQKEGGRVMWFTLHRDIMCLMFLWFLRTSIITVTDLVYFVRCSSKVIFCLY